MTEINLKINVPEEFSEEFKLALDKITKELVNKAELFIAEEIISKSKFTENDADELSDKIKDSMHKDLVKKEFL